MLDSRCHKRPVVEMQLEVAPGRYRAQLEYRAAGLKTDEPVRESAEGLVVGGSAGALPGLERAGTREARRAE